jgi:hypothetical protein
MGASRDRPGVSPPVPLVRAGDLAGAERAADLPGVHRALSVDRPARTVRRRDHVRGRLAGGSPAAAGLPSPARGDPQAAGAAARREPVPRTGRGACGRAAGSLRRRAGRPRRPGSFLVRAGRAGQRAQPAGPAARARGAVLLGDTGPGRARGAEPVRAAGRMRRGNRVLGRAAADPRHGRRGVRHRAARRRGRQQVPPRHRPPVDRDGAGERGRGDPGEPGPDALLVLAALRRRRRELRGPARLPRRRGGVRGRRPWRSDRDGPLSPGARAELAPSRAGGAAGLAWPAGPPRRLPAEPGPAAVVAARPLRELPAIHSDRFGGPLRRVLRAPPARDGAARQRAPGGIPAGGGRRDAGRAAAGLRAQPGVDRARSRHAAVRRKEEASGTGRCSSCRWQPPAPALRLPRPCRRRNHLRVPCR